MADPKQKGNAIFGQNYMQKFCSTEWDDIVDKSDEHRKAVQKISQDSSEDVGRELGANGSGPIAAIALVIEKADDLVASGQIDTDAAKAIKAVLETLKGKVKDKRKKDTEEKSQNETRNLSQENKKSAETFSGRKVIHAFEQFLAQITDNDWEDEVVKRYHSFIKSLSIIEKNAWSKGLEKGDQREKFALILRFEETKQAKDVAKGQNWI